MQTRLKTTCPGACPDASTPAPSQSRRLFLGSLAAAPAVAAFSVPPLYADAGKGNNPFPHKFKISLNAYSFNSLLRAGEMDLFDLLDFCARHNFDAIDPTGYYFPGYPEAPSDEYIRKFKRQAFLLGLDISGTGVRNDFSNPDEAEREKDIDMIRQWIIAAEKLGIPNVRVFAGNHDHEGYTRDQVFAWMAEDLKTCCEAGKEHGVIIAIQNHNHFLKTAADVNRLFDRVDSDWLGLNLDIGSYRQHDPYEEVKRNIDKAVTWQIKENVWIEGEQTPTDLVKLFSIIKDAGYRGYLPLETLGAGDPYEKVPALLEKVKAALKKI